ncbi:MAG: thioesterase II family protein [Polaromonas sp.]
MDLLRLYSDVSAGPVRLILFPHAGDGPAPYAALIRVAADRAETWALRLPGREDWTDRPPIAALGRLVDAVWTQWLSWEPKPPVLLGISFGSIIVHELALRAAATRGREGLRRAVVVSAAAPCRHGQMPPTAHLPNDRLVSTMAGRYSLPGQYRVVEPALVALRAPALRADMAMVEVYRAGPPSALSLPLAVWHGDEDRTLCNDDLTAWRSYYIGAFVQCHFRGGHFFLQAADAEVRQALEGELACAVAQDPDDPP